MPVMKTLSKEARKLLHKIKNLPYLIGHALGFKKLTKLHNKWIKGMVNDKGDKTLQAHRGSYKTTCVALALALIILLYPNDKIMFIRKTDTDVQEIIEQVKKILKHPFFQQLSVKIYGVPIILIVDRSNEIHTNLGVNDPRGTSQLLGIGTKSSITGKHYDRIFTDDIVNLEDRASKAERERVKRFYQELQNIKNRGEYCRIYNTGTPWHKEDAFTLMPNPEKWDCYITGLLDAVMLDILRRSMTAALFAANYELKHIAAENVIFVNPNLHGDPAMLEQGESHIDASYGGEDSSAFTICNKKEGKYYVLGKVRHKHIDDCEDEYILYHKQYMCKILSCENNGDKGYLAKDLRKKGIRVFEYHEDTNKFIKITSYLKAVWEDVIFCEGTDQEYIDAILDYNIDAEHDDCPDSLSSMIRKLWGKKESPVGASWQAFL